MAEGIIKEINLHLAAPLIALERAAEGKPLPRVFAVAALLELQNAMMLIRELETKRKSDRASE